MALANFFDKSALAAAQILQGYDRDSFETLLTATTVGIAFDQVTVACTEEKAALDLSVQLLTRLYPSIRLLPMDEVASTLVAGLADEMRRINPDIDLNLDVGVDLVEVAIVLGDKQLEAAGQAFYIGSRGWHACFSPEAPVGFGGTNNPYGAAVAACIGAANVFRKVFADQLPGGLPDASFTLDLRRMQKGEPAGNKDTDAGMIVETDIGETVLAGIGAIGQAVIWAIGRTPALSGTLHLVDPEAVDLSNLQRYILTSQESIGQAKVELAANRLSGTGTGLALVPHAQNWTGFVATRANWSLPRVLTALDTRETRIEVQGALPKVILNAWTQQLDLGISRHTDFINSVCLCCLYSQSGNPKPRSLQIAEALGIDELRIRESIFNNDPMPATLLQEIADIRGVDYALLNQFVGRSIGEFYHEAVCGGLLMSISEELNQQTQTPMVFQSALAGILLAADLLYDAGDYRKDLIPPLTRINLLQPLSDYLNVGYLKPDRGNCVCQDEDYQMRYIEKYNSAANVE